MASETTKHVEDTEARHSALEELYRDERRPALLLLSALAIAVLFFALGIMVGRWMKTDNAPSRPVSQPASTPQATPSASTQGAQRASPSSSASAAPSPSPKPEQRYALLIATFNTAEEARPLIKRLEEAGYKDVRTSTPRTSERQPKFSILVGHYNRDEAEQLATRMRATGDPRLRYARVIEE